MFISEGLRATILAARSIREIFAVLILESTVRVVIELSLVAIVRIRSTAGFAVSIPIVVHSSDGNGSTMLSPAVVGAASVFLELLGDQSLPVLGVVSLYSNILKVVGIQLKGVGGDEGKSGEKCF